MLRMVLPAGATVTFSEDVSGSSADLGECAGCFLAVVRNARALAANLAVEAEREELLAILAEGEIAAIATFGAALENGEGEERGGEGESRDAFRVVETAVRGAAAVLDSLGVRLQVRAPRERVRLGGPIAGLARGLAVAVSCAAVSAGRGGIVFVTYATRRGRLALAVRVERKGSSGSRVSFSPVGTVARWLRREGASVRVGRGRPPREWWFERPLDAGGPAPRPVPAPSLIPAFSR